MPPLSCLQPLRLVALVVSTIFLGSCQTGLTPILLSTELVDPAAVNVAGAVQRAILVPGGNYALVTMRNRPDLATPLAARQILCTAPSPDWATALAMAQQIQGSGGVTGGATGSLSASNSLTETVTALAGRTAGVVALRDGLYRACEAYANGVIGKDAYALILSQYGNLLVALAGSGGGAAASSGAASAPQTPSGTASGTTSGTPNGTPSGGAATVATGTATNPASATSSKEKTTEAPAGDSTATQMQWQLLQGLMVACISESDPTVTPADSATKNALLSSTCPSLMNNIVAASAKLLAPAATTPVKAAP